MKKFFASMFVALTLMVGLSSPVAACGGFLQSACPTGSDVDVAKDLENLVNQGNRTVGLPGITNFFEKQMVRQLYEMRDDPTYRTYSYIVNLNGEFIFICDSIGYGINASIQYSNPEKMIHGPGPGTSGRSAATMPQAEPNALFMPEGLAATYVMCLDPTTLDKPQPKLVPVYVEPNVVVSPFKLK